MTSSLPAHIHVRDAFVASDHFVLLSADYSQIEVRLMAHFSADAKLKAAIASGRDVFKAVAAAWDGVDINDVSDAQRNNTKRMVYGILYGEGSARLAEQMGIPLLEAERKRESFLRHFAGVSRWKARVIEQCDAQCFVETIFGRRRYFPSIKSSNSSLRARAERQAVNFVCQGSAADLIKLAMIGMRDAVQSRFGSASSAFARLVLQIHDEVLWEVSAPALNEIGFMLQSAMERVAQHAMASLTIPLAVRLSCGRTWGSLDAFVPVLSLPSSAAATEVTDSVVM